MLTVRVDCVIGQTMSCRKCFFKRSDIRIRRMSRRFSCSVSTVPIPFFSFQWQQYEKKKTALSKNFHFNGVYWMPRRWRHAPGRKKSDVTATASSRSRRAPSADQKQARLVKKYNTIQPNPSLLIQSSDFNQKQTIISGFIGLKKNKKYCTRVILELKDIFAPSPHKISKYITVALVWIVDVFGRNVN